MVFYIRAHHEIHDMYFNQLDVCSQVLHLGLGTFGPLQEQACVHLAAALCVNRSLRELHTDVPQITELK